MASSTASICVTSCALARVTTSDNGTPRPSTNRWRLLPFFPPIRRIGADGLLCQWCLEHCPVDTLPTPGNAFEFVVLSKARLPQRLEESSLGPLHELLVHRTGAAKALGWQGFPLAACPEDIHNGLEDQSRRLRRTTCSRTAQVVLVRVTHWLRHQGLHPSPEFIRHFPRVGMGFGIWLFSTESRSVQCWSLLNSRINSKRDQCRRESPKSLYAPPAHAVFANGFFGWGNRGESPGNLASSCLKRIPARRSKGGFKTEVQLLVNPGR